MLDDLRCADEEVRRLAVERIDALAEDEILPRLVAALGDADWRVRKAAVGRLAARSDAAAAAAALIRALGDGENPGRRNSAVEALVALGGAAVSALVAACSDADPDVRKFVVDTLAGIGDERAVDALVEHLEDDDTNVRAAAADALGAIGGERACAVLHETALAARRDPLVRFSALHALDALEVPLRADELAQLLGDPMLGPASLALLGRCDDDPGALDALAKGLESGVRAAREASMRGVLRLAERLDGAPLAALLERVRGAAEAAPGLVEGAVQRLSEAELGTQLVIVQFLGLVGAPAAVIPVLEAGRDEALAQVAQGTLSAMGDVAVARLDQAWSELDAGRRRDACAVLGSAGGGRAVTRLVSALEDRDPLVRTAAARALGELRVEEALAPLVHGLERSALEEDFDGDDERLAFTQALAAIAGPGADGASPAIAARAVELLAARLPGAGAAVRLAVACVLGTVVRHQDAALISLLLKDPSAAVRCAAVEAIARLEPERTPEPLHLAIADESPEVRIAAARALGASRRKSGFKDLCWLAEDEDVRVRAMAVHGVGSGFGADPDPDVRAAALAVLNRACQDEAPVALAVVEAASAVGGDAAHYVAPLLARPEPEIVREAARCIGLHGESGELETLLPLVSHSDWSVRAEVVEILAERGLRQAVPTILRRLETEQDDFVRNVTLAALQRLDG